MPTPRRMVCKACERHINACGPLSSRHLCHDCGRDRQMAAVDGVIDRKGPYYEKWRDAIRRAAERQ